MKAVHAPNKEPYQLVVGEWCGWKDVNYARCPGGLVANLASHKITFDSGELTVSPSILVHGAPGHSWHGFIEKGVWLDENKRPIE